VHQSEHEDIQLAVFGDHRIQQDCRSDEGIFRSGLLHEPQPGMALPDELTRNEAGRGFIFGSISEATDHSLEIALVGKSDNRRNKELKAKDRGGGREHGPAQLQSRHGPAYHHLER